MVNLNEVLDFIQCHPNCGLWSERGVYAIHEDQDNGRSPSIEISLLLKKFLRENNIFIENCYVGFKSFTVHPINPKIKLDHDKLTKQFKKVVIEDQQKIQADLSLLGSIKTAKVSNNLSKMLRTFDGKISKYKRAGINFIQIGSLEYSFDTWRDSYTHFDSWVIKQEQALANKLFSKQYRC